MLTPDSLFLPFFLRPAPLTPSSCRPQIWDSAETQSSLATKLRYAINPAAEPRSALAAKSSPWTTERESQTAVTVRQAWNENVRRAHRFILEQTLPTEPRPAVLAASPVSASASASPSASTPAAAAPKA